MDVRGTERDDVYDEQAGGPTNNWNTYYGLGGNDTIRMWQGTAVPGSGNNLVQKIASADNWRLLAVGYWEGPDGVATGATADLATGIARNPWGGTDTLQGVSNLYGGWRSERFYGNEENNTFSSGGGRDIIDGRGGIDYVVIDLWNGGKRIEDLGAFTIKVSVDGRSARVTSTLDPNFQLDLVDIEKIAAGWNNGYVDVASFTTQAQLAQEGLTGAPTQRWNALSPLGSAVNVTYTFVATAPATGVGAPGFRGFSTAERQAVRDILAKTSAVCGLQFTEVTESGSTVGQMRFGVSQQAQTKGTAYMPSLAAADANAGDVWMDVDSMPVLTPGSEGYAALLHEIGHALGLRHPRNVEAGDAWAVQMRAADDVTSNTVMSQTPSVDGLFRADWGPLDVAALRYLYGSVAVNAGNTTYFAGGSDAAAQRTIVDSGGADRIDASASPVGVRLDLVPGHSSSVGVTTQGAVALNNLGIDLNTWVEEAVGTARDDVLLGNAIDNLIIGNGGNDWIDGAQGTDTVVFSGRRADYKLSNAYGYLYAAAVDGRSGFITLQNVEVLRFSDATVDLQASTRAKSLAPATVKTLEELYVGFFNRIPEASGLAYWIDQLRAGKTLDYVANQFYGAGVALGVYPSSMSDQQFVQAIYANVLSRPQGSPNAPNAEEIAYWVGYFNDRSRPQQTKGTMVLTMLNVVHTSFENDPKYGFVAASLNNKAAVADYYAVQQGLSLNSSADNVSFGMRMAALITPTDTSASIALVGLPDSFSTN